VKLKLDENLPLSISIRLAAIRVDTDTVLAEGLGGRSDAEVWQASQIAARFDLRRENGHFAFRKVRINLRGAKPLP